MVTERHLAVGWACAEEKMRAATEEHASWIAIGKVSKQRSWYMERRGEQGAGKVLSCTASGGSAGGCRAGAGDGPGTVLLHQARHGGGAMGDTK